MMDNCTQRCSDLAAFAREAEDVFSVSIAPLLNCECLQFETALNTRLFCRRERNLDMVYGCCDDRMWRKVISRRHLIKGGASLVALGLASPPGRQTVLGQVATPGPGSAGRLPVLDVLFDPIFNGSFI